MYISVNMVNRPVLDVVVLGRFSLYTGWRHGRVRHDVIGLRAYDWLVFRLKSVDMVWHMTVPTDDGLVRGRMLILNRRGHCLAENKQQWFTVRKKICKNLNIFIYSLKINYLKSISCQRSKILSSEGILFDFLNLYFSYSVISGNGDHEEEYSLRLCFPSFSSVSVFFRALIFALIFARGERGRYDKIAYSSS